MDGRPYLAEVLSYPVKSLAGGRHNAAEIHPWGLAQDRRWMVVDTAGRFMTQREHPRMALLHAATAGDELCLRAPDTAPCTVITQGRVSHAWSASGVMRSPRRIVASKRPNG